MSLAMKTKIFYKKIFMYGHIGAICRYLHLKKVLSNLQIQFPAKVLDAGCGNGEIAFALAKRFSEMKLNAVDKVFSPWWEFLAAPNLKFAVSDLEQGEFEHTEYDLIYSVDVLEHIEKNRFVIQWLAGSLKRNGKFVILMPAKVDNAHLFGKKFYRHFEEWASREHIGPRYTLRELEDIIRGLDLTIIESFYTFGFWGQLASDIETVARAKVGILSNLLLPILFIFAVLDTGVRWSGGNGLLLIATKP